MSLSCEAEVRYTGKDGWTGSKSDDDSDSITVSGQDTSGEIEVSFSFSFEEAYEVRVTDVECEIESVD